MPFGMPGKRVSVLVAMWMAVGCLCLIGCSKPTPTPKVGIPADALALLNATVPATPLMLGPTATTTEAIDYELSAPGASNAPQLTATMGASFAPATAVSHENADPTQTPGQGVMARVIDVLDGDSMLVEFPDGPREVGYWGCNVPEDLSDWQKEQCTSGNRLLLACGKVRLDPEPLAVIMDVPRYNVWDGDTLLNAQLVRLGYAQADELLPGSRYESQILEQQALAQEAGLGIWSSPSVADASPPPEDLEPTVTLFSPTETPVPVATEMAPPTEAPSTTQVPLPTATLAPTEIASPREPTEAPPSATPVAPTLVPTATAHPAEVPTPAPTAGPTLQPTATQLPAPVVGPGLAVVITDVFFDGVQGRAEPDEYCEIANQGAEVVDLTGWRLNAGANGQDFVFPQMMLDAGQVCRVYTNEAHEEWGGLSFASGSALWKNSGDCGHLFDSQGTEVSTYCYD